MLPEQSGGEGNSSSRLLLFIFVASLDFLATDFALFIFAGLSTVDLSMTGISTWPTGSLTLVAPLALSFTVFDVFATKSASESITVPSMILNTGMGLPIRVSMKLTYL